MMKRSQEPRCKTGVKSFQEGLTELETCENYAFFRESYGLRFLGGGTVEASFSSIF
jgi:hypothetical protein